jgi:hypothetical protein
MRTEGGQEGGKFSNKASDCDDRGLYLNLQFSFKTHISFSGLYGLKLGDFLTNREDAPNVGQYLLITHSCFGGFFFSHKEHTRVNILTERNDNPLRHQGLRNQFGASIIQNLYFADFFVRSVSPNHARVFGASIY